MESDYPKTGYGKPQKCTRGTKRLDCRKREIHPLGQRIAGANQPLFPSFWAFCAFSWLIPLPSFRLIRFIRAHSRNAARSAGLSGGAPDSGAVSGDSPETPRCGWMAEGIRCRWVPCVSHAHRGARGESPRTAPESGAPPGSASALLILNRLQDETYRGMNGPCHGTSTHDSSVVKRAQLAADAATDLRELRCAQSVLLPALMGATLEQTAAILGIGRASRPWTRRVRRDPPDLRQHEQPVGPVCA